MVDAGPDAPFDARLEQLDARQHPVDRAQRLLRPSARRWPTAVATRAVPLPPPFPGRVATPAEPPSSGPVQTVWLTGDWLERGAGSSRMLRAAASSAVVAIGTATGGLAGAGARALPLAAGAAGFAGRASWARRIDRAVVEPTQRAVPVTGREQLAELEVEREHDPEHRDRDEQHERARPRQQRLERAGQEAADAAAAALRLEQLEVEHLERAERRDVGDGQPGEGHAPARAWLAARSPGHVPAATEQQERQQPPAGLEPRRDRVAPQVGERALTRAGSAR